MIITSAYFCSPPLIGWLTEVLVSFRRYARCLEALIASFAALDPVTEITLQSHPLVDFYQLYEEVQSTFPSVVKRFSRKPLNLGEPIAADLVILYNCGSTAIVPVVQQGLPLLAHWGAMSPLAQRLIGLSQLAGSDDGTRLATLTLEILKAPGGPVAAAAKERAKAYLEQFIEPPAGGLNEAIAFGLRPSASESVARQLTAETQAVKLQP
jgi:hypothetical protein